MSGHSKWHNIQAKKGKTDAARGKIFTKIGREIAIAVREGGSNPESNSKLRDVIAKAKSNNMPNDNIKRSIMKASGELGNVDYEEITYEGYAPGGVAVIATTITDNRNRTASDVRHCFAKNGGNMGTTGSVSFMFDEKGVIVIERTPGMDEEELKKLLFTHFMFSLKSHRRKEGHREQLMQEALKLVGWYNVAAIQEVSGARYEAALHLRSAVAALLETAPPELGLICKAFMLQEKKAVSKAAVCRELGLTLYELEKKMSEIEKILKNILDF